MIKDIEINIEALNELPLEVKETVQIIDPEARVYLFGSRARNDSHVDSDWDFFVATSRDDRRTFEEELLDSIYDLMLKYEELIQIVSYPIREWESGASPIPLYDTVRKEGIEL